MLIINRGKIAADGPVSDLVSRAGGEVRISVEASGQGVADGLAALPGVKECTPQTEKDGRVGLILTASAEHDLLPEIFRLASSRGWILYELHQEAGSLEDLFRQLTATGEAA